MRYKGAVLVYKCPRCGTVYKPDEVGELCPNCRY